VARWDQDDPVGQMAGPNYYVYVGSNPVTRSDPAGLMFSNTMDAYAVMHTAAFLMLLMDLGYVGPLQRTYADYDSRSRLERQISTRGRRQPLPVPRLGPDAFCEPTPEEDDPWRIYYRGLSVEDWGEMRSERVVKSNYQRWGLGTIGDALIEALDPSTAAHHVLFGSGASKDGAPWGSPLVSVTTNLDVARRFGNTGGRPSGVVIRFDTRRLPMYSGLAQDSEYLFFWQLGFDGESLSIYN